jgi:hypothetical protein
LPEILEKKNLVMELVSYFQFQAESRDSCCVFMTVHDVGVNHNSWLRFVNSPAMGPIREKAVFLHVDLLGINFELFPSNNNFFSFPFEHVFFRSRVLPQGKYQRGFFYAIFNSLDLLAYM